MLATEEIVKKSDDIENSATIDSEKKNVFRFALKLVSRFLVFLAVLGIICWLILAKMENLLQGEMEKFLANQAQTTAQIARERFEGELIQLRRFALLIESGNMTPDNLVLSLIAGEPGINADLSIFQEML